MSEVIVITSGKGGVGKTTTSANLGCGLAIQGKKVALVDADIGLRNRRSSKINVMKVCSCCLRRRHGTKTQFLLNRCRNCAKT